MVSAELMSAVRRRWPIVAATVVAALVAGWLTTRLVPAGPPVKTFDATSVILSDQTSTYGGFPGSGIYNLRTIAALATVGEVPKRVAQNLGYQGDPVQLAERITAAGNPETGILRITSSSTDPNEAKLVADAFAQNLVAFIQERSGITSQNSAQELRAQLDELDRQINDLNAQIGSDPTGDEVLVAQRDQLTADYAGLYASYRQLTGPSLLTPRLTIIQDAVPIPTSSGGLLQVRSLPSRLLLAALLGLLAGIGVVFVREKLDSRLYTKRAAEEHFDLPVLAEIPFVRGWRRRPSVAVMTHPKSSVADAFRLLAAGVMRRPPTPPQVILVTGPGPGEGKSTVTANLAAAYAEVGKKVLILSCDLHRPTIHALFGVPNARGLTDALRSGRDGHSIINGQQWRTALRNVRLVPSGVVPEKPGELLASPLMRHVISEARDVADIVLIDTAPILAASDAAHLFPLVDAVVVVGRAGSTTVQSAQRTSELLLRLGAPVVGATLNGSTDSSLPRGSTGYYADGQRRTGNGRSRRRLPTLVGLGDRETG
jgi:capsular exopolysaccharide synthesis family protein